MSDTPITDSAKQYHVRCPHEGDPEFYVDRDVACKLERKLVEITDSIKTARNSVVEAMILLPNVGEYISQIEAENAALIDKMASALRALPPASVSQDAGFVYHTSGWRWAEFCDKRNAALAAYDAAINPSKYTLRGDEPGAAEAIDAAIKEATS